MASKNLLELMNEGIDYLLQASIQCMRQHIMVKGIEGAVVENLFRKTAMVEMKHAENLAHRIVILSGIPMNNPSPIHLGHSMEEMLKENVVTER